MKNAELNWKLPTTRTDGAALPVAEIDVTEVHMSADQGANFVLIGTVTAPTTIFAQSELEAGDWVFRLVIVDMSGRRGTAVDIPVRVDTPPAPVAPPGPVTDVTVDLT